MASARGRRRALLPEHRGLQRGRHSHARVAVLLVLVATPGAAPEPCRGSIQQILLGQDVRETATGGKKFYRTAVVPPERLSCSHCLAGAPMWMLHGRSDPIDLGAGRHVASSESFGCLSSVPTAQGGLKSMHDPNVLSDQVIDAIRPWVDLCVPDGEGGVSVLPRSKWPPTGAPDIKSAQALTRLKVTAKSGRFVCVGRKGMLALRAAAPQAVAGFLGEPAWPHALVPERTLALNAIGELERWLPWSPASARAMAPLTQEELVERQRLSAQLKTLTDEMQAEMRSFYCMPESADTTAETAEPETGGTSDGCACDTVPPAFGADKKVNPDLLNACDVASKTLRALRQRFDELGPKKSRECRRKLTLFKSKQERAASSLGLFQLRLPSLSPRFTTLHSLPVQATAAAPSATVELDSDLVIMLPKLRDDGEEDAGASTSETEISAEFAALLLYVQKEMSVLSASQQLQLLRGSGFKLEEAPADDEPVADRRHGCVGGTFGGRMNAAGKQPRTGPCVLSFGMVGCSLPLPSLCPLTLTLSDSRSEPLLPPPVQFTAKDGKGDTLYPMKHFLESDWPQWVGGKVGGLTPEQVKRAADKHTVQKPYTTKALVSTRKHETRVVHGLSTCDHLMCAPQSPRQPISLSPPLSLSRHLSLAISSRPTAALLLLRSCHYGSQEDAILDGVNNAQRRCREKLTGLSPMSRKRADRFCLCEPPQKARDLKAKECATVKASLALSKMNYLELRSNLDCVPYGAQNEAKLKMLGKGFLTDSTFETVGLRNERSGAVILPSWWMRQFLNQRALVEGVPLKGRRAPRPPVSIGPVFAARPLEAFIVFGPAHAHLFDRDVAHPPIRVARFLADKLGLPISALLPSMRAAPRLSRLRTPDRHGDAAEALNTAVVTTTDASVLQQLSNMADDLGLQVQSPHPPPRSAPPSTAQPPSQPPSPPPSSSPPSPRPSPPPPLSTGARGSFAQPGRSDQVNGYSRAMARRHEWNEAASQCGLPQSRPALLPSYWELANGEVLRCGRAGWCRRSVQRHAAPFRGARRRSAADAPRELARLVRRALRAAG